MNKVGNQITKASAVAIAMTASILTVAIGAAVAAPETVVVGIDEAGDVRLSDREGLTRLEKRSIDLRRVEIQRVDQKSRILLKIRDVIRVEKFDQMFFVTLTEAADSPGGPARVDAGFTTKGTLSYASLCDTDDCATVENCVPRVDVQPRRDRIIATVANRCTPDDPAKIRIDAVTGTFRSDAPTFSRDKHVFPGLHDIRP